MKQPTEPLEEKWNAYSHALGVVLAFIGLLVLIQAHNDPNQFWPIVIYGLSAILLFFASTWYHKIQRPILKRKLRIVDHISIYYLIAGTYTPVCLWILKDSKGILLLYAVWGIAFLGTFLKIFLTGRFEIFSLLLYGVMGWLIVIDLSHLMGSMNEKSLFYLALGGAFYTIGMFFYALKKIPFNHLVWHLFVLGGAISHWFMIYSML